MRNLSFNSSKSEIEKVLDIIEECALNGDYEAVVLMGNSDEGKGYIKSKIDYLKRELDLLGFEVEIDSAEEWRFMTDSLVTWYLIVKWY